MLKTVRLHRGVLLKIKHGLIAFFDLDNFLVKTPLLSLRGRVALTSLHVLHERNDEFEKRNLNQVS